MQEKEPATEEGIGRNADLRLGPTCGLGTQQEAKKSSGEIALPAHVRSRPAESRAREAAPIVQTYP